MLQQARQSARVWSLMAFAIGCGENDQVPGGMDGARDAPVLTGSAVSHQGGSLALGSSVGRGGATQTTSSVAAMGGTGTRTSSASVAGTSIAGTSIAGTNTGGAAPKVLVFSRTAGYRHASIEPAIAALEQLARERRFSLAATEDASVFSTKALAPYDVVLFLSTTGDVLNAAQQLAFEAFIRAGGGYVGVHAASDTEYDWPWYGGLVGAYFRDHPDVQNATILVEDASHPATELLPREWSRTDEWYAFRENPRTQVEVLLSLDETTYDHEVGGMGPDHPIAWYHEYEGGRAFYTGLGHTDESYREPAFLEHLWGAIRWAAGTVSPE